MLKFKYIQDIFLPFWSKLFLGQNLLFLILLFFILNGCTSSKVISGKDKKSLDKQITTSPIFTKGFTGFQLYDPTQKAVLYEQYADKYFTPASNTKIFTYYTSASILGDSIPALKYVVKGDSLIFWGTGDPTLLHAYLPSNSTVIDFLRSRKEQLFFCTDNFHEERYGAGWMWDDYPYYYQVELSPMPIYGNTIQINGKKGGDTFTINPGYFATKLRGNPDIGGNTARFLRTEQENIIQYNAKKIGKKDLEKELPFIYSDALFLQLLQDSLERSVQLLPNFNPQHLQKAVLYSLPSDSVYHRMMQVSDNFLAEQLLLLCANQVYDTINTGMAIQLAKDSLFKTSPDELLWYDGSGLSRYNQFTPRTMVHLLEKIYQEIPKEKWQHIFPTGGYSGTLSNYFGNKEKPYVFAKTGTIRNVRCISGFIITRSGRTLIFSFMNNHIPGSSRPWSKEMEKVLGWIFENL